ncbi:MAG: DUF6265 family protein [Pseudomonadota bacterium]
MKPSAFAAAALLLTAAPALAAEPDFSWLAGKWIEVDGPRTTREVWHAPLDGAMSGVGQYSEPGKPPRFEMMTITAEPAGITFTAYLKGQPPAAFLYEPGESGVASFVNPDHDFPQRVTYRICGEDICGRIDGKQDGKDKSVEWRYRRDR